MSRCIDADALIEGYKHMGYDPTEHPEESYMEGWCKGFNSATDHCMHHVIHAPTIEPEPHWIPCKERLPDHYADVLVTNADETEMGRRRRYDGKWVDCYGDKMKDVTAWMPLPEPYKEGE